jgi:hypothetical protein
MDYRGDDLDPDSNTPGLIVDDVSPINDCIPEYLFTDPDPWIR